MDTHIEGAIHGYCYRAYGASYRVFSVCCLIQKVQSIKTHIEVKMYGD